MKIAAHKHQKYKQHHENQIHIHHSARIVDRRAGANQQPPPQINVSGSAEIRVVPDEIRLRVAVESRNAALEEARLDNDTRISAALAFLKQADMPDRDVKTDFISVQPDYDRTVRASRPSPTSSANPSRSGSRTPSLFNPS